MSYKRLFKETKINLKSMKSIFDDINKECKKTGESIVPYSDIKYYTDQIKNIFNVSNKDAMEYAKNLSEMK